MSLSDNLKKLEDYKKALDKSKNSYVAVGVIGNKLTKRIYDSGVDVVQVALTHEFGTSKIPKRSFLKQSFEIKKKDINNILKIQYNRVFEGKSTVNKSLNIVGVKARNISVDSFRTGGFGRWTPLKPETIAKKGTSTILVETSTLKQSIQWEVRDGTT